MSSLKSTSVILIEQGPWVFSHVISEGDDRFTSDTSIMDGQLVHLRDYTNGRYLQAEADTQNIIDHESGRLLDPGETHQKFRVRCVLRDPSP